MVQVNHKILGCLAGLAIGDAMGRPTELLFNYRRIERKFGRVTSLVGDKPGAVTDDTRLTLALADVIIGHGRMITSDELIQAWKHHPEFGWKKFLKSFKRDEGFWIGEHLVAWLGRLGIPGTLTGYLNPSSIFVGNEAAMMISPVGIIYRGRPGEAAAAALEVSRAVVAGEARKAAGAWAAAISYALTEGADVDGTIDTLRRYSSYKLRSAIDKALYIAQKYEDVFDVRAELYSHCLRPVTIDALETISIATAMFKIAEANPMKAVIGGANFGRDSDTIAGMAGLLSGAICGIEGLDRETYERVCEVNSFDLEEYAVQLAGIRV